MKKKAQLCPLSDAEIIHECKVYQCRYSEDLRKKLGVSRSMLYNYLKRIKAGNLPRKGPSGGQWKIDPVVEKLLGEATHTNLVTNFDTLADEVARLECTRKGVPYKKESVRTSQRYVGMHYTLLIHHFNFV